MVDGHTDALEWLKRIESGDLAATWPELVYVEIANALRTAVRAKRMARRRATETMDRALRWPIGVVSLAEIVTPALAIALDRSLTPYDACYVAVAEARGATLVTADRTLAAATPNAVLLD